jgi:hypothetical protein
LYVKHQTACFEKNKMLTFAAYDSMRTGKMVYMKYAAFEVGSVFDELSSFSR